MSEADRAFILAMAKHLPPSAATLRLLDVGGMAGPILAQSRQDLEITPIGGDASTWRVQPDSKDAVVAVNALLDDEFLYGALAALRPGGRLILVDAERPPSRELVHLLEGAGFERILVEPAANGSGVLMRGEKPYATADTLERVAQTARRDDTHLDFASYSGRYIFLLIRQTPNKPPWALAPGETVRWQTAAVPGENGPALLAFSGLPRAVSFMQPAVLANKIADVNKAAKFSRETARNWTLPAILNPPLEILDNGVLFCDVDPATAETPDE